MNSDCIREIRKSKYVFDRLILILEPLGYSLYYSFDYYSSLKFISVCIASNVTRDYFSASFDSLVLASSFLYDSFNHFYKGRSPLNLYHAIDNILSKSSNNYKPLFKGKNSGSLRSLFALPDAKGGCPF